MRFTVMLGPPGAKIDTAWGRLLWTVLFGGGLFLGLVALQLLTQQILARLGSIGVAAFLLVAALGVVAFLAAYTCLVRKVERRAVTELWAREWPIETAVGVLIGAVLFSCVLYLLWINGFALVSRNPHVTFPYVAFAAAALAAVSEELIFRGALFRLLEATSGTTVAILISSAIFGALHALNPGATFVSALCVALEAGLLLGLAYTATRSLWIPIGLHFGWDFAESGVFGALESGVGHHGFFHTVTVGPSIMSGAAFGPEGSLIAAPVCLCAAAAFLLVAVRSGRWISYRTPPDIAAAN